MWEFLNLFSKKKIIVYVYWNCPKSPVIPPRSREGRKRQLEQSLVKFIPS